MEEKSSAFCVSTIVVPAAFMVFVWGHGGEDTFFAGGAAALLALGLTADVLVLRHRRATRPGWLPLLYALSLLALAAAGWNTSPYSAMQAAVFLFLMTVTIDVTMCVPLSQRRLLLFGVVGGSALVTLYGIAQMRGVADHTFWHNGLFASRFVNNAHYAALAAATVPLAVGLMLSEQRLVARIVALCSAIVSVIGVVLAQSRAIWLVAVVVYGALFVLLVLGATNMTVPRRRWLWIGGLLLLAVATAGAWLCRDALAGRVASVAATRGQSLTHRLDVWRVGWEMVKAHPMGVGLGCFGEEFLRYKTMPDRYVALRAHNELVQMTAELGWLGFVILCACSVLFFRDIIRTWFPLEKLPVLVLCASAGIDIFLWHGMVDFPLRLRANALLLAVLLGCMSTAPPVESPSDKRGRLRFRHAWIYVLLLAAAALFSIASSQSDRNKSRANDHLRYARLDEALPWLERAAQWMPLDPEIQYELGGIDYAKSLWSLPAEKRRLLERACRSLERSARLAGSRGMTHLRWAWALADLGEDEHADARFRDAIACDPTLGCYHMYYADFLLERKRHEEAVDGYGQALAMFHDSGAVDLREILRKVHSATGNLDDLRRLSPRDEHSQRVLSAFLKAQEKP